MKTAIYLRVSTLEQAENGYSLDEQEAKLRKYCEIKEWNVVHVYKDPGYSGAKLERPGLQQLIRDCQAKRIENVIVYKLDRLSRSQRDTLYLIEDVFNENDVKFLSLSENFDTATPFGRAMVGILSVFSQLEREQIKERMMLGKQGRAKDGKAMSYGNPPFGYTYDKNDNTLYVDTFQASIVKRIFKDYLNGKSIHSIRKALNEEGHLGKRVAWSYKTVRQVLSTRTYTGVVVYMDNVYPGMHQAIIDKATFEETQEELKRRQILNAEKYNPRPFRAKYMLSGMLECGYCTAVMKVGIQRLAHKPNWYYYRCFSMYTKNNNTQRHYVGCPHTKRHGMNDLEELVIGEIKKLQLDPTLIKDMKSPTVDLEPLEKELETIDKKLAKMVDLYLIDDLPLEKIKTQSETLKQQRANIIKQLNNVPKAKLTADKAINTLVNLSDIDKLDYETKKKVVRLLIEKIYIKEDEITIKWNFTI